MTRSIIRFAQPCVCHRDDFPCRHHLQTDNKQTYNNVVKLPEGRSGEIRFLLYNAVSGSVPRTRNNHTALFR